ncbi:MAG TPA: hypothetical protein VHW25_00440 [Steroidobacteraceae bacterium]|jgi:hypothetical protein|nr:hypothetical protein [Steroidobacteraceae bacterium]
MKAIAQFSRLIRVYPKGVDDPEDDHRVLTLFRNRAELKKAYGELQEEVYRLKDRIKQQEGATARVQEMLGSLETRLGLTETAYPALVFYQLRALWQRGREILEQFTAELSAQQEERERRTLFVEFNRTLFSRRQSAEAAVRTAQAQFIEAQQLVADLTAQRALLTRFWHYFKRRDLDYRLVGAGGALGLATLQVEEMRAAMTAIENDQPPEFPGLSLDARRAINIAAIAYAEVLCLRLADTPLMSLAKEATGRREPVDAYGGRPDCEALIALIARARVLIESKTNVTQDVKARSETLRPLARYRNSLDTAPTPESVSLGETDVLAGEPLGARAAVNMPNVLAEDTWDMFRVLLR